MNRRFHIWGAIKTFFHKRIVALTAINCLFYESAINFYCQLLAIILTGNTMFWGYGVGQTHALTLLWRDFDWQNLVG